MKFGLSGEQYNFIITTVVRPIADSGGEVYCYGSRARGDHKKYSDLDLMIESDLDLSSQISRIQETLSKSNFPFKVEVVQFRDFASSYKQNYERDKRLFAE